MLLRNVVIVTVLVTGLVSRADAQPAQERRFLVDLNGGIQGPSTDRTDAASFNLNREVGTLAVTQSLGPYAVLDGGASVRLWKRLGLGLSVSRSRGTATGAIEADVPHPFFFEFDREATGSAAGLEHREAAYHLSAQFQLPLGTATLVRISGGPTYFEASQQLVSGIHTAERGDPFNEVDIVATIVERISVTSWGYNVGVDLAYFGLRDLGLFGRFALLDHLGVGFKARYSWGKPDIVLLGVQQERALQVGLLHALGGVRVAF